MGYHSRAGSGGNPLSHTLSSRNLVELRLDGAPASEFRLQALTAGTVGVPVALVTGDRALCDEVSSSIPGCGTVAVSEGEGASTTSLHPAVAVEEIRRGAEEALRRALPTSLDPGGTHRLEVVYQEPSMAFVRDFYPQAFTTSRPTAAGSSEDHPASGPSHPPTPDECTRHG